ncbi:hypothetical protein ACJMK2_022728 [Sinanodonta woodiana]|uniref:B30.2/SPRY domain-containing protein n=1 Tax=Sinanodonta woodiana TaxID=1069815 RepID=A0ABD3TK37_SINWO
MGQFAPYWTYTAMTRTNYWTHGFTEFSNGIKLICPSTLVRHSDQTADTDGARWGQGITSGRHVFEIIFPNHCRKPHASVGIATKEVPLYIRNVTNLIGGSKGSWGIDLQTRKVSSNGNSKKGLFPAFKSLPDQFYMCVDLDLGCLEFWSAEESFGEALSSIPPDVRPLYPSVSVCHPGAVVGMVYRGKGKTNLKPIRKKR